MPKVVNTLIQSLLTLFLTITILILAVKLTVAFKPLYYMDIHTLHISSDSGLPEAEIKTNYDYLVYYLEQHKTMDFKLPTLPSSAAATIHFKEVKRIFNEIDFLLPISALLAVIGGLIGIRKRKVSFLKWSAIASLLIPIALSIPFAINFDESFTIFHKIFFRNNFWLFDPSEDPVINILPQPFFMHCALLILFILLICSFLLFFLYKKLKRAV